MKNSDRNFAQKINCIMETKNSNRNLCQKCIVLCKLKTVRETCLKK